MKASIWLKTEIIGLVIGLIATGVALFEVFFAYSFSDQARSLFLGGQPLAIVLGVCIVIGMMSFLFFIINLLFKRFIFWWLRLLGFLMLYLGFATIGASGI